MEEPSVSSQRAEAMSAEPLERLQRSRMSLQEYLALPEGTRAEYVDGEVIVTPPPSIGHNRVGLRLARLLEDHLPATVVTYESGVRTHRRKYRIPDLVVQAHVEDEESAWIDEPPVLVAEILSPGTRTEDTLRKSPEYLAAGIGQYWIVDREHRTITVLGNDEHEWELLLALDADNAVGEVRVGDHGTVPLDLAAIMPE